MAPRSEKKRWSPDYQKRANLHYFSAEVELILFDRLTGGGGGGGGGGVGLRSSTAAYAPFLM
ncbi:hypothetical protein JOB18_044962 [Solea senegalensis]|uniref:Uncharacterized protein n=1 Tax=Solea senegalensis TaxID=28829 RepID=A0AAV6PYQ6_SOLSE|nr:hypothetical protein JOB18_044962 [Solea senegalensis]